MNNSITITATRSRPERKRNKVFKWYLDLLQEFKSKEMGYAAIAILAQSCIGSIAVMLLMMHDMPTVFKVSFVFTVIITSMFYNAAVLSQLKSKTVFNLLIISVFTSSAIIIANLF